MKIEEIRSCVREILEELKQEERTAVAPMDDTDMMMYGLRPQRPGDARVLEWKKEAPGRYPEAKRVWVAKVDGFPISWMIIDTGRIFEARYVVGGNGSVLIHLENRPTFHAAAKKCQQQWTAWLDALNMEPAGHAKAARRKLNEEIERLHRKIEDWRRRFTNVMELKNTYLIRLRNLSDAASAMTEQVSVETIGRVKDVLKENKTPVRAGTPSTPCPPGGCQPMCSGECFHCGRLVVTETAEGGEAVQVETRPQPTPAPPPRAVCFICGESHEGAMVLHPAAPDRPRIPENITQWRVV